MTVECMICGKDFKYLGKHIKSKHDITTNEYLKQFPDASLGVNHMQIPEIAAKFMGDNNSSKRPEVRKKISESLKRKVFTESHLENLRAAQRSEKVKSKKSRSLKGRINYWMIGDKNPMRRTEVAAKFKVSKTDEHKKKISDAHKGKKHTEEHRKHSQAAIKVAMQNFRGENNPMSRPEVKQKHQEAVNTDSYRKIISEKSKENWEDPEYVKRWMKANNIRPNKPETRLNSMLQALVPGGYEYNGGFECGISLGRKIPDFVNVNGKKKVIELYGDYWHEGDDPEDRIVLFKRYGYETLVIWEHELNDSSKLTTRILKFEDLPSDKIPRQLSLFEMDEIEK